jgi:hypothetical protein
MGQPPSTPDEAPPSRARAPDVAERPSREPHGEPPRAERFGSDSAGGGHYDGGDTAAPALPAAEAERTSN